ncbi:M20/M25/M40 family metallo-hydrolase [Flavihumibacter petaseus]|uniref:Peptidase M28 family protein n=1 Tax=Flavihumibacter petaseus NBRC 106054 TaxID=1220578 RepID=A0A0E9MWB1_9BACT|nr:M20/M25/M40 family metallo-hydrolase [Flavihumibacter petaseus]GAO41726.1 peptidase M28 family protein [Flavihumibacter petaseus NBRC 106054]
MRKIFSLLFAAGICPGAFAQIAGDVININEVSRIEKTLSADDMEGRAVFSAGIGKAAAFIADEFRKAGLQTPPKGDGYLQTFTVLKPKYLGGSATVNGKAFDEKNVVVITGEPDFSINEKSGYEIVRIGKGTQLFADAFGIVSSGKNKLVLVDTSFSKNFQRLTYFKRELLEAKSNTVFLLADEVPSTFEIRAKHEITKSTLSNVVGILPGKSKKDEFVIFSGHYDHLGIGKPLNGDSIYNGANDDAAGTTAVVMLAKYFKALNNNERTIIFAAFTAEETGGFGSRYFSMQFEPAKVKAMFNIEMIGTESKWGTNSAYITGYEKSDMGKILEKNLQGSVFKFFPDPYPDQQLFYRSDNATLARLGVPAHTISTSKMDSEKFYHTADDEFETLDMKNMTEIIKAIALSSTSIVAGTDTPSRVDTNALR